MLGYEERTEETPEILDKIIAAKKKAKQLMMQKQEEKLQEEVDFDDVDGDSQQRAEDTPTALGQDKFAKNDPRLKVADKSYLAQFYIKPSYNVN